MVAESALGDIETYGPAGLMDGKVEDGKIEGDMVGKFRGFWVGKYVGRLVCLIDGVQLGNVVGISVGGSDRSTVLGISLG